MTANLPHGVAMDIGGTSICAGLIRDDDVVAFAEEVTPSLWTLPDATADEIRTALFARLTAMVECWHASNIAKVAIAFPGPVSADGYVASAPTIWGDRDAGPFPLADALAQMWPAAEIAVLNDVTAAGLYYARKYDDFLLITVSSGIGSKLFLRGEPVLGCAGAAGEIGHVRIDHTPDALMCECGGQGHLAALASGRGPFRLARESRAVSETLVGDPIRAFNERLIARAHAGDADALATLARGASALGQAIALAQALTDVRVILIMGGFALAAGEPYRRLVVEGARRAGSGQPWDDMIQFAADDLAALRGALRAPGRRTVAQQ